ncbi:methylmalonyl Co-A mutase-associated GTPase MeaB [Moheibacter sediminis]|uniref:LAO/AO transport system kinase n=1 Tax=Moheibacter sediminis TaxID=1434700 RepID=A0A1W1ZNJ8_9FLAO|nr:methylmalonyl Co-A mutase-associated GTPase MeaB [Moheibacter sediminis]SMC49641.1 LAO/AO transport system kinase [Moheibacter sediminis]
MKKEDIQTLAEGIKSGNRVSLSRAITLAESSLEEHQKLAHELIQELISFTGKSKRIAITGVPGVGKSTFIESFGKLLTQNGYKVAVLAIDPSSSLSGGSILGDKTRMEDLARNPDAYIRPSATGGHLGGVASRTYESVLLCEAAGFDVILIETVGVGQSETLVNDITDIFIFLQIPGAGDELQGIKRGIMEMADLIFVNKVDDFGIDKAKDVKVTLARSLQFLPQKPSGWKRKVLLGSGLNSKGLAEVWELVQDYFDTVQSNGYFTENRKRQDELRVVEYIKEQISNRVKNLYKENSHKDSELINPYLIAEKWVKENLK